MTIPAARVRPPGDRAGLRATILCLACAALGPALGQSDPTDIDAALASPQAAVREGALDTLIAKPDLAPGRLEPIAALLGDVDLAVAGKAATALAGMGAAAFPAIRRALSSGSPQQRWGATVALYRSKADPDVFLTELTSQLSEKDDALVLASLGALARLQSRGAGASPALKALLQHPDADIRRATLATFGAIGPAARDFLPDIEPFVRDASAAIRLAAADAMRKISPPVALTEQQLATDVAWLDRNLPALMREMHVPGVSIAIIQRGRIAWARGFGVADERTGKAVTTDTVFEACSMSKPILALVAMQLVQEGRLDLDRPLVAYLGRDYLPDEPEHRRITARMALTHRTGFVNWRPGYDELGGPLPLPFAPGSEYTYSGEGMLFLQRAIEAIAGEPLDRLAQERLFAPLGLARTSFVWTDAIERDLASGHRDDGAFKERTRYRKPNAAYSLYTTPSEYARMMLTLMRPGSLGGHALTAATIDLMLQRQLRVDDEDAVPRPGAARSVATYRALGWSLDVTPEGDIVQHSGSNSSGFKSFGQFNPAKGSGLVIMANGDGGYGVRAAVTERIGNL
jgi:CubicO group peptidase (beta-lactamase class C family)